MTATVLVATVVHDPDDTRIRERLIRTLQDGFRVVYACPAPGPTDRDGIEVVVLRGGRVRRNLSLLRISVAAWWDILVLHDPEAVLAGLVSRLVRRRPVVLDVHENVPMIPFTRGWAPQALKRPLSLALRIAMRLVERMLRLTLAEPGYSKLFKRDHVVFPNYPMTSRYPAPVAHGNGRAVYVGDVTEERGIAVALTACRVAGVPVTLIGRTHRGMPGSQAPDVEVVGRLPNPVALSRAAECSVGLSPLLDLPNYRDSLPTKILEYLAVGLPVVASDLPGSRALVSGLEAVFFFEPGDSDSMAAAIESALVPSARSAAQMQVDAVRERFSWPADEVRAFYRSLI